MLLQYRAAAIAGVWTQVVFGFIFINVFEAFYQSAPLSPQPMTFRQIVTYIWLGQALLAMLPWNADGEIVAMIRGGGVAYELCRPLNLYWLWYARAIALRTAPTLLRSLPIALMAAVVLPLVGLPEWRIAAPASLSSGLLFAASLLCALLLGCAITTLVNISLVWTVGGPGIVLIATALVSMGSGMIIPLPLFPDWISALLQWSPLAGLVDLPFRIYSGNIPPQLAFPVLARQVAWTIIAVLFGQWLLRRGMRRVVIQGG